MSMRDLQAGGSGNGPRADRPKRRTFTAGYKQRILAEYESALEPGAKGALLRRENLYDSNITKWREQRDKGALSALAGDRSAPATEASRERAKEKLAVKRLENRNAKLEEKLRRTEAALEIMGKAVAFLEMFSESADTENW
jgi:transposase-like protein